MVAITRLNVTLNVLCLCIVTLFPQGVTQVPPISSALNFSTY